MALNHKKLETRKINPKKLSPIEKRKDLVGVDIFFDNIKLSTVEKIITTIKKATQDTLLDVQAVIVRGVAVWPNKNECLQNTPDTYNCRFVSKNDKNKIISQKEIVDLLNALNKTKMEFISIENLYVFDGKIAFSEIAVS